jgi:hypothetical protein
MFYIRATLLARGAVGALASGLINVIAAFAATAWTVGPSAISWFAGTRALIGTAVFGLIFAPITMVLLPLTWLSFRRSRYRNAILYAAGLVGGALWSLTFGMLRDSGYSVSNPLTGGLCGVVAASCFLRLPSSSPTDRSELAQPLNRR